MKADLHIHSDMSDGPLSIDAIIRQAKLSGIGLISVTDHDTTQGQNENLNIAQSESIKYIKGIEISAYDDKEDVRVHILGYDYSNDALLEEFCAEVNERRREAGQKMLDSIIELGYAISPEDVLRYSRSGIIYRPHIMHALYAGGFINSMRGTLFDEWFGKDGLAYFPYDYTDPFEAIEIVHQAGGLAVLAHPAYYNNWECIPRLIDAGLDGMEVLHPHHTKEDIFALMNIIHEKRLIPTSGSDFHGMYGDEMSVPIGFGCVIAPGALLERLRQI
jgi:predicted metal-dependent phosphoesterase TrpH